MRFKRIVRSLLLISAFLLTGLIHHIESQANTTSPAPVPNTTTPRPTPATSEVKTKPNPADWAVAGNKQRKERLLSWLIDGCWSPTDKSCKPSQHRVVEYEGYDGFYNNLARPDLGAIDTPLLRRWPAAYKDGVYEPSGYDRPNPLDLSDQLLKGDIGSKSKTGKTALLVFFGQQVVEEILDAQRPACPPEYFNIKIPENHSYQTEHPKHSVIPVLRTRYDMRTGYSPNNPRQQLNEITPWLDGGLVYGTTKAWSDHLRLYSNGTLAPHGLLATSHDGLYPDYNKARLPMANPPPPFYHSQFKTHHETLKVERFFKLGNPRGNENPFLLTFGILWFRWHNHIAHYLHKTRPKWNDEKVYNEARKWVIASQQHIVVNTWLPEWLGEELDPYKEYNPSMDPQIDQFFQAAAFRFGHTLVPPGVYVRDYARNGCNLITELAERNEMLKNGTIRTCNSFWRPQEFIQAKLTNKSDVDIDRILMGMAFQLSELEDHNIVEDLRGRVFGPLEFSRRDLMAINIQRGRDHGLPDYNSARQAFGLTKIKSVDDFRFILDETKENFKKLHKNRLDNVDTWVGGILETNKGPGELFTAIIKDQFTRIRDGDRFWFENKNNGLFDEDEIRRLKLLTVYDIILSVTNMNYDDIQQNPFAAPTDEEYEKLHSSCKRGNFLQSSICQLKNNKTFNCHHLPQINNTNVEPCTEPETYDYFSNSEVSFIFTFIGIGLCILGFVGILFLLARYKKKKHLEKMLRIAGKVRESFRKGKKHLTPYSVSEWVDRKSALRPVVVVMDPETKQVQVRNQLGHLLRAMDLTHSQIVEMYIISDGEHLMLRVSNDYDLVLKFESEFLRENFLQGFEEFINKVGVTRQRINMALHPALRQAVTRKDRQKRLEMFFRVVFSQAFKISHSEDEILKLDSQAAREIIYTELTMSEFAEALSMPAESEFVRKMFTLVDKDKNRFISFREFVDMLIIFAKGTADDKAKLMFDMYDINATGQLTLEDFKNMITSLMETVSADVEQRDLETAISSMLQAEGLTNKEVITVEDFQRLLSNNKGRLGIDQLNLTGIPTPHQQQSGSNRRSFIQYARLTAFSIYRDPRELRSEVGAASSSEDNNPIRNDPSIDNDQEVALQNRREEPVHSTLWIAIKRVIENYSREVFWLTLYTLVLLAIFAERAYYYSVEREHSGLRRIAGYGVTITRGAASAMMFTYSTLLITMCRNTITMLRDTFLHIYIPFDSAVSFHKYIAIWALVFTVMHCIGHAFNFYSISTQTSDDLTCLFRNFFHATHEIPKFHYWCWQTITGVTGVLLTLLAALMYIFALPYARKRLYNAFWFTHSLYPLFYLLIILHGAGRLIQPPFFYYFFLGPCILFTLDRLVSTTRRKVEIPVVKAELLPSDVTFLEFKKPNNFEYKSGQWVRVACPTLNTSEYHPFTLSSAPHEKNLTIHIRAVGPWTTNIRSLYDPSLLREKPLPKIHLDGPYGEGHQDWYQFDVAVLVGGGIGVTPFASILKDIVFRANIKHQASCKKVYFLWVTKTQKHFEWLVDIIRELENTDVGKVVSVHIFITQFYQKFDLRTILLYICERHFQRLCDRSLLTGLKAVTHFGRPNFTQFFKSVQAVHPKVRKVGVFSCGPPPMTQIVDKACVGLNKETYIGPTFQHHFKNF
ncbi:dual oxidase-like [Periplaneta americana]|uniref:dual oxidase-like n=1 Tax=Periplaneta americana TaxID=6978 RepID=UPI0037E74F11